MCRVMLLEFINVNVNVSVGHIPEIPDLLSVFMTSGGGGPDAHLMIMWWKSLKGEDKKVIKVRKGNHSAYKTGRVAWRGNPSNKVF